MKKGDLLKYIGPKDNFYNNHYLIGHYYKISEVMNACVWINSNDSGSHSFAQRIEDKNKNHYIWKYFENTKDDRNKKLKSIL